MLFQQICALVSLTQSSFWAGKSYSFRDPCRRECNHGLISACGGAWKAAAGKKTHSRHNGAHHQGDVNWELRDNAKRP